MAALGEGMAMERVVADLMVVPGGTLEKRENYKAKKKEAAWKVAAAGCVCVFGIRIWALFSFSSPFAVSTYQQVWRVQRQQPKRKG